MTQAGYIYVLINQSASEIVKIGKTQRSPDERAKELSSATGVPTPFVVVYQNIFQDCNKAELFIHTKLDKYRVSNNREFFQLPIHLAIDTVLEAKKFFEQTNNVFEEIDDLSSSDDKDSHDNFLNSSTLDGSRSPSYEIFTAAESYRYGSGDTLQDYNEAFNLYQKAAKLGSAEAFLEMGCMCRNGEGRPSDNARALEFFKEGIRLGNDNAWAEMAMVFHEEKHFSNEDKCWDKYFLSNQFIENASNKPYNVICYIRNKLANKQQITHRDKINSVRNEVISYLEYLCEIARNKNSNGALIIFKEVLDAI